MKKETQGTKIKTGRRYEKEFLSNVPILFYFYVLFTSMSINLSTSFQFSIAKPGNFSQAPDYNLLFPLPILGFDILSSFNNTNKMIILKRHGSNISDHLTSSFQNIFWFPAKTLPVISKEYDLDFQNNLKFRIQIQTQETWLGQHY